MNDGWKEKRYRFEGFVGMRIYLRKPYVECYKIVELKSM